MAPLRRALVALRNARALQPAAPMPMPMTMNIPMRSHQLTARSFATDPSSAVRRPRAVKKKASEARRRVAPKQTKRADDQYALTEQQPHEPHAPAPHVQSGPFQPEQPPQTLGTAMKESFLWGIGMALAFTFVGVIFSAMEETSSEHAGVFAGSEVVVAEEETADKS